jgi:hypothetical protein
MVPCVYNNTNHTGFVNNSQNSFTNVLIIKKRGSEGGDNGRDKQIYNQVEGPSIRLGWPFCSGDGNMF